MYKIIMMIACLLSAPPVSALDTTSEQQAQLEEARNKKAERLGVVFFGTLTLGILLIAAYFGHRADRSRQAAIAKIREDLAKSARNIAATQQVLQEQRQVLREQMQTTEALSQANQARNARTDN